MEPTKKFLFESRVIKESPERCFVSEEEKELIQILKAKVEELETRIQSLEVAPAAAKKAAPKKAAAKEEE